jgi:hypothetical protein
MKKPIVILENRIVFFGTRIVVLLTPRTFLPQELSVLEGLENQRFSQSKESCRAL